MHLSTIFKIPVEMLKDALVYWRTLLAVYFLGGISAAIGMGKLSVFLSCVIGSLLFFRAEKKNHSKLIDFLFRLSLALIVWFVFSYTDGGSVVVSAMADIFL